MLLMTAPAVAVRRDAALAIDANTGEVLYSQAADEPRYPASLTKMMTLYIAFSEIEAGRLSYDTHIKISETAASVAPSKLDLEPGSEITLIDAIKALVTKSANDVAVAIAERIAGSEEAFARLMTQRARAIGMRSTHFQNASGLPDLNQLTTARDMLTLALRIHDEFPKHYRLFSLRSFTYKGETHRNHNTLLFHYPGTEGMKTGYTRMSGFNLVTSVKRDGKHVVAAVFGGSTAGTRNAHMRSILTRTLAKASKVKTRQPAPILIARPKVAPRPATAITLKVTPKPAVRPAPPPQPAPAAEARPPNMAIARAKPINATVREAPVAFATANGAWTPVVSQPAAQPTISRSPLPAPAATAPPGRAETVISKTSRSSQVNARPPGTLGAQHASMQETRALAANDTPGGEPAPRFAEAAPAVARQPSSLADQAAQMNLAPSPGLQLAKHTGEPQRTTPASKLGGPTGAHPAHAEIEIGIFATAEEAESRMEVAQAKAPALVGRTALALPVEANGAMAYRARFSGFEGAGAEAACRELRRLSIPCRIAASQP
jgi:D-alanyl-D-alanine carboxypeptidase